jgi:hypothetical protein
VSVGVFVNDDAQPICRIDPSDIDKNHYRIEVDVAQGIYSKTFG